MKSFLREEKKTKITCNNQQSITTGVFQPSSKNACNHKKYLLEKNTEDEWAFHWSKKDFCNILALSGDIWTENIYI